MRKRTLECNHGMPSIPFFCVVALLCLTTMAMPAAAADPVWTYNSAWNLQTGLSTYYSGPCFVDLDGDGDYDLLVGENGGVVYGYENTGSATSPAWTAKSAWNTPDTGTLARPAAGDLDGDGDADLLVGQSNGNTLAYENTGSAASPAWTLHSDWNPVDIGARAKPALADLDNDGDFDLMIGERYGISYAYENTGTAASPVWTARTDWDAPDIGSADPGNIPAPAFADIDDDGDYDLMIGDITGITFGYENTGSVTSPVWTAKPAWDIPARSATNDYSAPALADLDNDGDVDLLTGSYQASTTYAYENTVAVVAVPVAAFSADPLSGTTPLTVTFTDLSTGNPTGWTWTIEGTAGADYQYIDTTSSTSQNPHVEFLVAGTYDVILTATNAAGSDDEIKTDYISASSGVSAPIAGFAADVVSGTAPLTVTFADQSSNDPTSWSWDFGDGSTSDQQNPVHEYPAAGTYTVTLTATNAAGSDDEIKTDYITVTPNLAPTAAFSGTPTSGTAPLAVQFTDESTSLDTSTEERVANGGFESGDETGWTDTGSVWAVQSGIVHCGSSAEHTVMEFETGDFPALSQSVDLTGVDEVSLWYYLIQGEGPNPTLKVAIDSTDVGSSIPRWMRGRTR